MGQEQVLPSHVERAGLFGFNLLHPNTHTVVLTSDERSALAVYQAAKVPGLALPKGTLTSEVCWMRMTDDTVDDTCTWVLAFFLSGLLLF